MQLGVGAGWEGGGSLCAAAGTGTGVRRLDEGTTQRDSCCPGGPGDGAGVDAKKDSEARSSTGEMAGV